MNFDIFTSARRFLNNSALVESDSTASPARLVFSSLSIGCKYIIMGWAVYKSTLRAKQKVCPPGHMGAVGQENQNGQRGDQARC